jgi:hypothetical protein
MLTNEKNNPSGRNVVLTPLHPSCRLCHYAGYSNICTHSHGGVCPYVALRNTLSKETAS